MVSVICWCIVIPWLVHWVETYSLDYKGFDNCGVGGWHCSNTGSDYEVVYDCASYNSMEVRLWLWTARIPSRTTVYAVSNCRNVELHFDCTMGYRSYTLRQFRATNIGTLEILAPLRPHVFLHDNDEMAHAPPDLAFYNVTKLKWADKTFAKATGGRCRTKQQFMKTVSFDSVNLTLGEDAFSNLTLDSFTMQNVRALVLPDKAVEVAASGAILLANNQFSGIHDKAFQLEAEQVNMTGNEIGKVSSNGISVKARNFQFINNKVETLQEKGLNVLARVVNVTGNEWKTLKSYALSGIAPGEKGSSQYTLASQFIFQFSGNSIQEIEENSLHPNYHAYKNTCSKILVENNSLPCTCKLPFEDPTANRNREWWQHFYGELVLGRGNYCSKSPNCTLQQTLQVLQRGACTDEMHAASVCANITTKYFTPTEDTADLTTSSTTVSTPTLQPDNTSEDSKQDVPASAKSTNSGSSGSLTIALSCFGAIIAVAFIMYSAFHVRNRLKTRVSSMDANYRPQRGLIEDEDEEGLIRERFDSSLEAVVGIITTIRSYISGPNCPSKEMLTRKVAIITGGSSGAGHQVAIELLNRGASLVIASRNTQQTTEIFDKLQAAEKIKANSVWRVEHLDLASQSSIKKFVQSIHENCVDLLINNAGVCDERFSTNEEGIESHFATNYLGHFLLTHLLHPKLKASSSSRVINTAAYVNSKYDFDLSVVNNPAGFTKSAAFGRSKLAILLMTRTLASAWHGDNITVNAVNPGLIRGTNHRSNTLLSKSIFFKIMAAPTVWLLTKTPHQASQTLIYLAVAKEATDSTGRYFTNCTEVDMPQATLDKEAAERLYQTSLRMVKLHRRT